MAISDFTSITIDMVEYGDVAATICGHSSVQQRQKFLVKCPIELISAVLDKKELVEADRGTVMRTLIGLNGNVEVLDEESIEFDFIRASRKLKVILSTDVVVLTWTEKEGSVQVDTEFETFS